MTGDFIPAIDLADSISSQDAPYRQYVGELKTLTEAAKLAPGRLSVNSLWRWCRRGVLSRSGERIRLEHRRWGGKIYTRIEWLEEFSRRLAEADAKHFDLAEAAQAAAISQSPSLPRRRRRTPRNFARCKSQHLQQTVDAEAQLDAEGV